MKVIDITEFFSERGGGVRSYLEAKGRALRERGHRHLVIAPGPAPAHRDEGVLRVGGPALPYDRTYHLLTRFDRVLQAVDAERPDVLEVHSPYLAMGVALLVPRRHFGVRTFLWHADFIDTYLRPTLERLAPPTAVHRLLAPAWAYVRAVSSRCEGTLVAGRRQLVKLHAMGVGGLHHVPFGIDRTVFRPDAADRTLRRQLLGGDGRRGPLAVAAGRLSHEKRFDVVIEAFKQLRDGREAVLIVLGDGPERAALQARARGLPVRFLGFERDRNRVAAVLASADVFLHGCPHETFGLTVAEARSCGLPVVVPDQGGAAEDLDGSCGAVYQSCDPAACAAAARRLLACDRGALRARARAAAAGVTSVDQHFDALLELYAHMLEQRATPRAGRAVRR